MSSCPALSFPPFEDPTATCNRSVACEQARKGARIRKGGHGEEMALAEHLTGLAPTPQRLADAGSLAETLVRVSLSIIVR